MTPQQPSPAASSLALRGSVAAQRLKAMLNLGDDEFEAIVSGLTSFRRGGDRWYRWRELADRLGQTEARELVRKLIPPPSRRWLGGYPQLVAEWHPHKNKGRDPRQVSYGSQLRGHWICAAGPDHEWSAIVGSRTTGGTGCPFCAGRRASVTNSLRTLYPELASQWHPTLNGSLTPDDVPAGSTAALWWQCQKGPDHVWRAQAHSRTVSGTGCPACANQALSVTNSIATVAPSLLREWHSKLNQPATPDTVSAASTSKFWWKCPAGRDHKWKATPRDRIGKGRGCPFCAGQKVSWSNSLAYKAPAVAAEWHPEKNGTLTPGHIGAGSHRKSWWRCSRVRGHQPWMASVANRVARGSGCPACGNVAKGKRPGRP